MLWGQKESETEKIAAVEAFPQRFFPIIPKQQQQQQWQQQQQQQKCFREQQTVFLHLFANAIKRNNLFSEFSTWAVEAYNGI